MASTKYGKLTVRKTYRINGIQFSDVVCDCGAERSVAHYRLTSGQLKSCGARACRQKPLTKAQIAATRSKNLRRPTLPWTTIEKVVREHERGKMTVSAIAEKFNVGVSTVVKYVRIARVFGSVAKYQAHVEAHFNQE